MIDGDRDHNASRSSNPDLAPIHRGTPLPDYVNAWVSTQRWFGNKGHVPALRSIGHFALTALAWPALTRTSGSRVVGLGSLATLMVRPHAGDMQSLRSYNFFRAYAFSKHAMHGFILELDRRVRESAVDVSALLAHPGYAIGARTLLRPGVAEFTPLEAAAGIFAVGTQGKNRGAAPIVRAALDPSLSSGDFVGPQHLTRGRPTLQRPTGTSASREFGGHVWALAEEWTGLEFDV